MKFITNFINFFNGKKTIIGSIFMTLSIILTEVVVGIWEVEGWWIAPAVKTLSWAGMLMGGTGLIHKAAKKPTAVKK